MAEHRSRSRRPPIGWSWVGASGSGKSRPRVTLPDGLGEVRWRARPGVGSTHFREHQIHVLVTEQACASRQAMGDRLLGPQVVETDLTRSPRLRCDQYPGAPGPTSQYSDAGTAVVPLPSPFGDRQIHDGLVVRWSTSATIFSNRCAQRPRGCDAAEVTKQEVDEYLAHLEPPKRETLEALRRSILAVVPMPRKDLSFRCASVPAPGQGGRGVCHGEAAPLLPAPQWDRPC